MPKVLTYGEKELRHLSSVDSRFAAAIARIGLIERETMPDLFTALMYSIVGQQISSKAQETVWTRVITHIGNPTPSSVANADPIALQGCGLSARKVRYLQSAAKTFLAGNITEEQIRSLSDEEAIDRLTELSGVGAWTANMLLLFSLERSDILCYEDFGLRNGCRILLELESIDRKTFESFRQKCSPYGTTASLYLWEINRGK